MLLFDKWLYPNFIVKVNTILIRTRVHSLTVDEDNKLSLAFVQKVSRYICKGLFICWLCCVCCWYM